MQASQVQRTQNSRLLRVRRGLSKTLLIGVMAGLLVSSFGAFGLYLYLSQEEDPSEKLDVALRLLGKGEVESAAGLASSIREEAIKKKSDHSKRHFVLGVNARTKAKTIDQQRVANQLNEKAVKHLEESQSRTFPSGFIGLGNYHLGMALFELFQWEKAEEPLEIASERYPQGRADAIERLVDIDLSQQRQDIAKATDRISHWKSLTQTSIYDDERTTLKVMQTLIAKGEFEKGAEYEKQIPLDSPYRPNCDLLLGRCLRKHAMTLNEISPKRQEFLDQAMQAFQSCLKAPKIGVKLRRQANLEVGNTYRDMGKLTEAISTFSILRLSSPYEPESLAAGIEELELLLATKKIDEMSRTLEQVGNTIYDKRFFNTDQLPLSVVRERIVQVGNRLIDNKHYAVAAAYTKRLPSICDELDRLRLESRNYSEWATSLQNDPSKELERLEYYRNSAKAYRTLTQMQPLADEYSEWLWKAIENFRHAGNYKESNQALEKYLAQESRDNRPKGYFIRARNYSSLEDTDGATRSLEQVLSSNSQSPLIYDARLELARIKSQADQFDESERLLLENLSEDLKPESPVWQESLFELGSMLFARGEKLLLTARNEIDTNPSKAFERLAQVETSHDILKKSVVRIEDYLRRYESDPRRFQLLYQMAKAYQLASYWPELQLSEKTASSEDAINNLRVQRRDLLTRSRQSYRLLRQAILQENVRDPKSSGYKELLRNSYFGEADLYFFEGDYESAMKEYREASNWFINEPEALEAHKQLAICEKQLGKYADSRRTLEYSKSMLQRIPADRDPRFRAATALDRAGWETYLNSLISELDELDRKSRR